MQARSSSEKRAAIPNDHAFINTVFSWSLDDILDENLLEVGKIPESFHSAKHYLGSYVLSLVEETRAQLHSRTESISAAPFAEVVAFSRCKHLDKLLYDVKVDQWKNRSSDRGKEPYKTLPGDIFILADVKPETLSDLQRVGKTWTFALVTCTNEDVIQEDDEYSPTSTNFKIQAAKEVEVGDGMDKSLFVIFLINVTTNRRIWGALHMFGNLNIIQEVLSANSLVKEHCSLCSTRTPDLWNAEFGSNLSSGLNKTQTEALLACLHKVQCEHEPSIELIWGPPGTGKTKTVSTLLCALLRMKCRTLACAPTNVAVKEVATRVLQRVIESQGTGLGADTCTYSVGDILLFGNKDRLKVDSAIEEIYLNCRVERLTECFAPLTGWSHCLASMIEFFEDCISQYSIFLENEMIIEKERNLESETKAEKFSSEAYVWSRGNMSFLEFVRDRFLSIALPLKECVLGLCIHIPETYILKPNIEKIVALVRLLDTYKTLLFQDDITSEELQEHFSHLDFAEYSSQGFAEVSLVLSLKRIECLSLLKSVRDSLRELDLPSAMSKEAIVEFCFRTASLLFCTASSSYKLHFLEPLDVLVIDEAAQLKECEAAIPVQITRVKHAILIGDECQLPAMVESKVSSEAGFGRSLFERLSSLGHPKHLLDMQYRMHPFISRFPNSKFYFNKILDAPNVTCKSYKRQYLPLPMFGPYSVINVFDGREELDDIGYSRKNMVEVAIVLKLVRRLYKAWNGSSNSLTIGVISPYAAQVSAIHDRLDQKYESTYGFSVRVRSVDGFQGGEEDVVIISTVRANSSGSIGFLSDPRRTNVALTRARHCLWILGNERTLTNSDSIWKDLVFDAKQRRCFFNVDEDKELAKTILDVKKEFDQLDDLLKGDSTYFRSAKWKVLFSENFRRSFGKLSSFRKKTPALNLLLKLCSGWRPRKKNVDSSGDSFNILKQFKVEGLYIICSVDIVKEKMYYTQVLKVWDILPLEDIPRLVKRLDGIFERYTDDFMMHCKEKCLEGDLEVPKTWTTSMGIVRYKSLSNDEVGSNLSSNDTCFVENSKVSDSLLLMKFYSLSSGVVSHLLSGADGRELELPFEVTDEEREIILFQRSTFILGRSGTGKTTVLTMKLFKKEQDYHMATEGYDTESGNAPNNAFNKANVNDDTENVESGVQGAQKAILRQLFVTVSSKLCNAVKHQVSRLNNFASGKQSVGSSSIDIEDIDGTAQFKDIPNSLIDVPPKSFPLVISFFKFLMMLDGTIGNSYFERFPAARQILHGQIGNSGSLAMQNFIRTSEVTYERFCTTYWPRLDANLTKNLDSSRFFTEIMSQIKGGFQAGGSPNGRISREDYVTLSGRKSTLSKQQREKIYDCFEDYEKLKMTNGHFDMADFVTDLHNRLQNEKYEGDLIDFVYIDEVQDLTMRQVALFKYICNNVSEGYVFSGDTAQTIARGIDFRFEDIRSLFYNEFVLGSRSEGNDRTKQKGQISKIFQLSQNFRTHIGVLKLAQSVIDLLYRFFPAFVDILKHETSQIFGEAPILLETGEGDENAIVTIFGNNKSIGGSFVGFGAEQVILVRDDSTRTEVCKFVGRQALVLTIVECKGLEFQDVLLYNFFGSSPLRNKWRVLYEYMKEQNLLDDSSPGSFPTFNQAKHNVLCSELKQLYVAITRTRQRLWICENPEGFAKPMFDYWRKKALVQVRKLDSSLALAMQIASSPAEWKLQGYKLLREGNYEMATMCFERAGDEYGEKFAKAAGLKATADKMHASNPETSSIARRQAAEIFESIGKAEYAAECFYMLNEFERAGRIYLQCGETAIERAGECFCLAGCYEYAAEVYAKGNHFSKCLYACTQGKVFDIGLQYIQYWKQVKADTCMVKKGKEIDRIEQEFLESCAHHYYKLNDRRAMMKYVRDFNSIDSIRTFLKNLTCLDELLSFEEDSGNFLEAANIAKQKGDVLLEADLLGKAEKYQDASRLIIWHVFACSVWLSGNKGWPLKQFPEKEKLLTKARSFAKNVSDQFYELSCVEADVLLNDHASLLMLKQYLNASQEHKSTRGEILTARKILDMHLNENPAQYGSEDDMIIDIVKFSESKISKNQVSSETLVYFWNFWKDKILNIFEYLGSLEKQGVGEFRSYGEFCLNYFGVRREFRNLKPLYLLLIPDAYWVKMLDSRILTSDKKFISINVHQFISAARRYWCSELLSVGMAVLFKLEALYSLAVKNYSSLFCQSRLLIHVYAVAKFLLGFNFMDGGHLKNRELLDFIELSTERLFGCVYPPDWKESMKENMISLRRTELFRKLIKENIFETATSKAKLSYGQLGRISLVILGSGKLCHELYKKIAGGITWNMAWMSLIEDLTTDARLDVIPGSKIEEANELSLTWKLHSALVDAYNANWMKEDDYISPECFLYLVERQLILLSYSRGYVLTTKSSFTEWLIYLECHGSSTSTSLEHSPQSINVILEFLEHVVRQLLYNNKDTMGWIRRSYRNGVNNHYACVILRLVIIACLLLLNFSLCSSLIFALLGRNYITDQLPSEFVMALLRRRKRGKPLNVNEDVEMFAEVFKRIGNPLVVVSSGQSTSFECHDAIFLDMVKQSKQDMMTVLFPSTDKTAQDHKGAAEMETSSSFGVAESPDGFDQGKRSKLSEDSYCQLKNTLESLNSMNHEVLRSLVANDPTVKAKFERAIHHLGVALDGCLQKSGTNSEDGNLYGEAAILLSELKQLNAASHTREMEVNKNSTSRIEQVVKKVEGTRTRVINQISLLLQQEESPPAKSKASESVQGKQNAAPEKKGKANTKAKRNQMGRRRGRK